MSHETDDAGAMPAAVPPSGFEIGRMLESLALPATPELGAAAAALDGDPGSRLDRLVTEQVAARLWVEWNPDRKDRIEDHRFRRAFRDMVAECVLLGFRTDRLRALSGALPDPERGAGDWAAQLEGAIAGRNKCRVALSLAPPRYHQLMIDRTGRPGKQLPGLISSMRDGLFYELGIVCPPMTVRPDDSLEGHDFRIEWNDLRLPPRQGLDTGSILVNETVERLRLLGFGSEGRPATNPANGREAAILDVSRAAACEAVGVTIWTTAEHMILVVSAALRRNAGAFMNRYLVWHFLQLLEQARPRLVGEVRARIDTDMLVRVLRALLTEEITIRDLSAILERLLLTTGKLRADLSELIVFPHHAFPATLAGLGAPAETTLADRVEDVRGAMSRYISHKYTRGQNTLIVYLVERQIEARLADPAGLRAAEHAALLRAVGTEVGSLPATAQNPVILTSLECRAALRRLIRDAFPNLAVLSYQELAPDMNIQPIARISADDWPG